MRAWGIVGLHLRKKVRTTIPEPTPVSDLLRLMSSRQAPNTRYHGRYLSARQEGRFLISGNGVGAVLEVNASADNAAAESFNAALERETFQGRKHWGGARTARLAVFRWATRRNTRRRHSRLGQISPIGFEQQSATLITAA